MIGQISQSHDSQISRPHGTSIHILGDDSLLHTFSHCRRVLREAKEGEGDSDRRIIEKGEWVRERWWYNLAHVCRRWRCLVLTSASHLDLCLVFTYGTPVADMLAHSPPFPLVVDYGDEDRQLTQQDKEGISLVLQRRRRVRRIQLRIPTSTFRKLVVALDGEFPVLEYLYIEPLNANGEGLVLPETFKAPHLRRFVLRDVTYSPGQLHLPPPSPRVEPAERVGQCTRYCGSQLWRTLRMFIYILDDDSLLNIFSLCRPGLIDKDETDPDSLLILRGGHWAREVWWYKLVHVCRRWRYLILGSGLHLDLRLRCTYGTPVADMLAHSPPLPLIIDCLDEHHNITAEEEAGLILALQQRDRVRRIRLRASLASLPNLSRFIMALENEFPALEYLYLSPPTKLDTGFTLPGTFQAPRLRHLVLGGFAFLIGSALLTPAAGLVTLSLTKVHPSTYFRPSDLLQRLILMPHLETLRLTFHSPVPNRDVERQLFHNPITVYVTLPNLRWFAFRGASTYLEALLPRMTTPSLEKIEIWFFHQLTYPIPNLLQFMGAAENFRVRKATFEFNNTGVIVRMYPHESAMVSTLYVHVRCEHLDWQVSSMAQIFNTLTPMFPEVEHLSLDYVADSLSEDEEHSKADRTQWRELLRPFGNVKTLQVAYGLVEDISGSLQPGDGEPPIELLPELKELRYSTRGDTENAVKAFIDARNNEGHPITITVDHR